MKKNLFLIILLLINFSICAQIKGKVVDQNNQAIPFVNIAVENENIGATSEENGDFNINLSDKNKNLVFSALGYEKKTVIAIDAKVVVLTAAFFQLNEIVLIKKFGTKFKEIGKTESLFASSIDKGPKMDAKFFPYLTKYSKTRFIKQIVIETDSKIEGAGFKIHFYNVNADGFPGQEMLQKDLMFGASLGSRKTFYNVLEYNLQIPKNGLFVAFEKLIIEKNKFEKTFVDSNTAEVKIQKAYFPWVLYNYVEREFQFTYSGGKWNKQSRQMLEKLMIYEPSINLVLSN